MGNLVIVPTQSVGTIEVEMQCNCVSTTLPRFSVLQKNPESVRLLQHDEQVIDSTAV